MLAKRARMSFEERAKRGDPLGAFRYAAVAGSLWAIGSSWSTAIRQIAIRLFPQDTVDVVVAELISALLTTGLGVTIAILVTRPTSWCSRKPVAKVEESVKVPGRRDGSSKR